MKLVKIMNNFHTVKIRDLRVWFSYKTPVAFQKGEDSVIVCENKWGRTTGKHINHVKERYEFIQVPIGDFENKLLQYR